jgi:hypothetical protein
MISLPFGSFSTAASIPFGNGKFTGCENQSAKLILSPAGLAENPTHKICNLIVYHSDTPVIIFWTSDLVNPQKFFLSSLSTATLRVFSSCESVRPCNKVYESWPFGPFTTTHPAASTVTVTPCGIDIGFFQIFDMDRYQTIK